MIWWERVLFISTYWKVRDLHVRMLAVGLRWMWLFFERNFSGGLEVGFYYLNCKGGKV